MSDSSSLFQRFTITKWIYGLVNFQNSGLVPHEQTNFIHLNGVALRLTWIYFLLVFVSLVVNASTVDCMERLISKMTRYVSSGEVGL